MRQKRQDYLEAINRFRAAAIDIDSANPTLATCVGVKVPDGSIGVSDSDGEGGNGCPIASVSKTGIKTIDRDIGIMGSNAWGSESRLCDGMVALGDWRI